MKKKIVSVILIASFSGAGQTEDLMQIYREAQKQDATLASARATWQATQERLPQGRAGLLPSVNLNSNLTYVDSETEFIQDGRTIADGSYSYGATISATQPLYRKQNSVVYEQAKRQIVQSNLTLASAEQELIIRVAQAYFDILLSQDSFAFTRAKKAAIAEQLAQAKRNFEVGTATITDTNEAQARFDQTVAEEIAAQNDLELKARALESIIGRFPKELKILGPRLELKQPEPTVMEKWVERAEGGNYQVQINRILSQIADLEMERNRAAHLPTVDLVASYGQTNSRAGTATPTQFGLINNDNDRRIGSIAVQLAIPLYSGGSISSRVREAIANQERARQDVEAARRIATQQSRQFYVSVVSGIAQVRALEQALVSSETALASSKLGMEVGVRTNVDVLNAQQQVFQVRRDLSQARYNYLLNNLRLKAAIGNLKDIDLEEVNRSLMTPSG